MASQPLTSWVGYAGLEQTPYDAYGDAAPPRDPWRAPEPSEDPLAEAATFDDRATGDQNGLQQQPPLGGGLGTASRFPFDADETQWPGALWADDRVERFPSLNPPSQSDGPPSDAPPAEAGPAGSPYDISYARSPRQDENTWDGGPASTGVLPLGGHPLVQPPTDLPGVTPPEVAEPAAETAPESQTSAPWSGDVIVTGHSVINADEPREQVLPAEPYQPAAGYGSGDSYLAGESFDDAGNAVHPGAATPAAGSEAPHDYGIQQYGGQEFGGQEYTDGGIPVTGYHPSGYPTSDYQAPDYQAPGYTAAQYNGSEYTAPEYTTPDYQAPDYQPPQPQATQSRALMTGPLPLPPMPRPKQADEGRPSWIEDSPDTAGGWSTGRDYDPVASPYGQLESPAQDPSGLAARPPADLNPAAPNLPGSSAVGPLRIGPVTPARPSPPLESAQLQPEEMPRPQSDGSPGRLATGALLLPPADTADGGWRRLVYKLTRGLINPGPSAKDIRQRQLIARARTPLADCHRVAVLSLKGGVGKTTTTVGLGSVLASMRGDRIVAIDANPDRGTLGGKVPRQTYRSVRDLLDNADRIDRYVDVRRYLSQADSRLEVLASSNDPEISHAFSDADYRAVDGVLQRHYSVLITDCGTGILHSAMHGVLALADTIVVVGSASADGGSSASATLDWLEAHGYGHLVRDAVTVLSTFAETGQSVDVDALERHFSERTRQVVRIPFDAELASGGHFELDSLKGPTRQAYLHLAAAVADRFGAEKSARQY